jgi:hypothetical protein
MGGDGEKMRVHAARRLQALHDVLQIRADQESAFQGFIAATRPQEPREEGEHGDMGRGPGQMGGLTTPERLDRLAQRMDVHQARRRAEFQRVSGAVKALYAVLTPDQRRAFDALPVLLGPGFGLEGPTAVGPHMGGEHMGERHGGEGHEGSAPPPAGQ